MHTVSARNRQTRRTQRAGCCNSREDAIEIASNPLAEFLEVTTEDIRFNCSSAVQRAFGKAGELAFATPSGCRRDARHDGSFREREATDDEASIATVTLTITSSIDLRNKVPKQIADWLHCASAKAAAAAHLQSAIRDPQIAPPRKSDAGFGVVWRGHLVCRDVALSTAKAFARGYGSEASVVTTAIDSTTGGAQ